MRLIDADYLKTWFGEKDLYTYDYIMGTIDDTPTIEPETKLQVKLSKEELQELVDKATEKIRKEMEQPEQKMGRWTYNIDDIFPMDSQMECGNCHASYPIYLCNEFKFCPNCGAKMEE